MQHFYSQNRLKHPAKGERIGVCQQFSLRDFKTLYRRSLAHRGGEGLERGEDLPKPIALVHTDVPKVFAALLAAGQPLLRLPVPEVPERALLGQTGCTHLRRGAQSAPLHARADPDGV